MVVAHGDRWLARILNAYERPLALAAAGNYFKIINPELSMSICGHDDDHAECSSVRRCCWRCSSNPIRQHTNLVVTTPGHSITSEYFSTSFNERQTTGTKCVDWPVARNTAWTVPAARPRPLGPTGQRAAEDDDHFAGESV